MSNSLLTFFLEIFYRVGHGYETVNSTHLIVDAFMAEPIAHGATCFDGMKLDMFGSKIVGQLAKRMCTLQIHPGRSREVKDHQSWQRYFCAQSIKDGRANVVYVEINKTGFRPKDAHTGNKLIVWVTFAI